MTKFVFEGPIVPEEISREDGGQAVYVHIPSTDEACNLFVRLHSWNEQRDHMEMASLVGRKVRLTLELVAWQHPELQSDEEWICNAPPAEAEAMKTGPAAKQFTLRIGEAAYTRDGTPVPGYVPIFGIPKP